jgi:C1A family cysteine protease
MALKLLGSMLLLGNRNHIDRDFIFCLMESKSHQQTFSTQNRYSNTIELHNLCSHFGDYLHNECMDYMKSPLYYQDQNSCKSSIFMDSQKWSIFVDYMREFNKIYNSDEEISHRYYTFHDNLEWISEHNLHPSHTYTVGIGRFTDMTHSEYKEFVKSGGLAKSSDIYLKEDNLRGSLTLPKDMCGTMKSESGSYPTSMDWRSKGAVTPVRDQGQQGTCYAHSASEAVESAYFIKKGVLPNLSVQQIVDCSYNYGNHGNNGGMYTYSWTYIHDSGLTTESAYPYTAGDSDRSSCKPFTPYTYVSDCKHVPTNELQLTYAVSHQPISVAIEADSRSFQHYTSGVYNDPDCGTTIDHAVVAVGYGTLNGQDYWTVRNSWGTSWGQDGYILIARNSDVSSTVGQCAIATYAAYPIV